MYTGYITIRGAQFSAKVFFDREPSLSPGERFWVFEKENKKRERRLFIVNVDHVLSLEYWEEEQV